MARIQWPGSKCASAIETALGATNERWPGSTSSPHTSRTVSDVISRTSTSIAGRLRRAGARCRLSGTGIGQPALAPVEQELQRLARRLERVGVPGAGHDRELRAGDARRQQASGGERDEAVTLAVHDER